HVALLGLMSPFDRNLGIRPAPYDWGYVDDDSFADMIVREYHTRVDGRAGAIYSSDYDRAATNYLLLIARHWPADIVVRALAAVLKVVQLPFTVSDYSQAAPPEIHSPVLLALYKWRAGLLWLFEGGGALIAGLALVALSVQSIPAALGMLLLLVYFAGYPAIQFHPRHFFHLEFIGIGALAYALTRLPDAIRWRGREWRRALVFVAAAATLTAGLVTV